MGDGHVERVLGQARADQGEARLGEQQEHRGERLPAVGTEVAQQPPEDPGVVARRAGFQLFAHAPAPAPARSGSASVSWPIDLSPWRTQPENTTNPKASVQ